MGIKLAVVVAFFLPSGRSTDQLMACGSAEGGGFVGLVLGPESG